MPIYIIRTYFIILKYTFPSPMHWKTCSDNLITINTYCAQIVVPMYHFPLKRMRVSWVGSWFQVWGKSHVKLIWTIYFVILESKEITNNLGSYWKETGPNFFEKDSTDQRWENLNVKKENDCKGLKHYEMYKCSRITNDTPNKS